MNILYMGPLSTLHVDDLIYNLSRVGYEVSALNLRLSPRIFSQKVDGIDDPSRIYHLYENCDFHYDLVGRSLLMSSIGSNKLKDKVRNVLRERKIDVILSYWGSGVFPEIRMIEKSFDVPIVHIFDSYPVSRFSFEVKLENLYCGKAIEKLEGRIHSTTQMLEYMKKNFDLSYGSDLVFMQWLGRRLLPKERLKKLSGGDHQPHIVFIGNPSLEGINDVASQINQLTQNGIHVHLCRTNRRIDAKQGFVHTFEYKSRLELMNGTFSSFLTQFDASIILYDIKNYWSKDRYKNSTPSRFLYSLITGLPIILPQGMFTGCEQIVSQNGIGFSYKSYEELKKKINNGEFMAWLERNAMEKAGGFTFESNWVTLDNFLKNCALK